MKKLKVFAFASITIVVAVLIGVFSVNAEGLITSEEELLACVSPDTTETEEEVEVSCKLGANFEIKNPIEIADKVNVTLDLNGKSITPSSEYSQNMISYGMFIVHNGGTLSVNDLTGEGKISVGDMGIYAGIVMTKNGDESIKPATLVVNGGTIEGHYYAVVGNGSRPNTSITINDGTLKGLNESVGLGIFHPQVGTLNVNGGTISGTTGIEMRSGELNVKAGTIIGDNDTITIKASGSGSTTVGAGIAVAQHNTANNLSVNVSGGTIKGYYALYESNPQENTEEEIAKVTLAVTGGTFETMNGGTEAIYSENKTAFITGGTFNSYAKEYLATDADITYKLTEDTVFTEKTNVVENTKVTLDLNGKTLTLADNITDNYSLVVAGELTIQGNGTVEVPGPFGIGVTGTLTVKNGTFNQPTGTYLIGNWGTTIIEDGTFYSAYSAVNGFSGNTVEVKGGSFTTELYEEYYWTVLGNAEVSGGTFNNDVTEYVKEGLLCGKVGDVYKVDTGYNVNVTETTNGEVSVDKTAAIAGEEIAITVTPNAEYTLSSLKVVDANNNEITVTDNKFTMPSGEVSVTAEFEQIKYAVNVKEIIHGTVTANKTEAAKGEEVTVTVTPNEEYELTSIKVLDKDNNEVEVTDGKFTMPSGEVSVTVELSQIKYAVEVSELENGTALVDKETAVAGEEVTVTVTPNEEYELTSIKVLDKDNNEVEVTDGKFTMPSGKVSVTVELSQIKYAVEVSELENGTVSVDKTEAAKGETVTITAKANEGYELTGIKVLDAENNEVEVTDGKFTMPSGKVSVTVGLADIRHTVKLDALTNGTVSVDKPEADRGDTVTITVTPNAEYTLSSIKVLDAENNEITVTDNKFTMPNSEVTVSVELSQIKYDVKVTTVTNGTVSVDKTTAAKGEEVTVNITPNEGYELTVIKVLNKDNKEVSLTDGKFTMPSGGVTVSVELNEISYTTEIKPVDPTEEVKEVEVGVKETEETQDVLLDSLTEILKDEDNQELASIVGTTSTKVEVEITKVAEETIEEVVVEKMQEKAGDAKIATFFDINVLIKNAKDNEVLGNISTLTKEIELMILLPEDLKNKDKEVNRTYYVVRQHGEYIDKLPTEISKDGKYLVFKSKDFSTYALAYEDKAIKEEPNPATYDGIGLYVILGSLSLIGLVVVSKYKKKKLHN